MTTLVLVRHGQTDWNRERRIQGLTDIPLNETGRQQALDAAGRLRGRSWDGVITSPLSRARDTALIISEQLSLPAPVSVAEISERNFGEGEGLTGEEVLERFPDGVLIPGRETRAQVAARVTPALAELAASRPGQSLIVVTHGGVIGTMLRYVSGGALPLPGELITNGSVHEFGFRDGQLVLVRGEEVHGPRDPVSASLMG
ncbi:histidine phosphatase family protein [Homoserinimonas sp. OAct 916]|uniref:histidine phosphatase family protein n=1 Tax=Homoserinimonas sp. OAct 916 TaxID=2211450 RepID=UPI000DBE88FD|nr:histidine phosphatase family protein [Homoserinimonas sp. OAct 916]